MRWETQCYTPGALELLREAAISEGLTIYHRDVFVMVREDGGHEVLALAV
jgi:hypothetical protein